jgi:hypothetical protein
MGLKLLTWCAAVLVGRFAEEVDDQAWSGLLFGSICICVRQGAFRCWRGRGWRGRGGYIRFHWGMPSFHCFGQGLYLFLDVIQYA